RRRSLMRANLHEAAGSGKRRARSRPCRARVDGPCVSRRWGVAPSGARTRLLRTLGERSATVAVGRSLARDDANQEIACDLLGPLAVAEHSPGESVDLFQAGIEG